MPVRNIFHICRVFLAISLAAAEVGDSAYRAEIQKWREGYEENLKKDNGWLTLAGLFWLKEGENDFGTGSGNAIVLPKGSAPGAAGTFLFHQGQTRLRLNDGVPALVNGSPLRTKAQGALGWLLAQPAETLLHPDTSQTPDRITLGRLTMIVIQRGNRFGIRLWDNASKARTDFRGSQWFPVHERFRVMARFTSYPQPKMIPILNVLGDTEQNPSPGYATFELAGKTSHLEPLLEGDHLFFIMKDLTSGRQTYAAGRFLYTGMPKDGRLILDFNKAENPPCAFTVYATCPLPPKQNHQLVEITAGERKPGTSTSSH
jgi:uncharacterized protein (DUF1684 family)